MIAENIAGLINIPLRSWPGNCYGISKAILDAGLIQGQLRYGHYHGPIKPGTLFYKRPIINHGWIEVDNSIIVDPTRYVFEGKQPYIWQGVDYENYYDPGGNLLRKSLLQPLPEYNPGSKQLPLLFPDEDTKLFVDILLHQPPNYTMDHIFWLANLPFDMIKPYADRIYQAISAVGCSAFIPIDNRQLAQEK